MQLYIARPIYYLRFTDWNKENAASSATLHCRIYYLNTWDALQQGQGICRIICDSTHTLMHIYCLEMHRNTRKNLSLCRKPLISTMYIYNLQDPHTFIFSGICCIICNSTSTLAAHFDTSTVLHLRCIGVLDMDQMGWNFWLKSAYQ